MRLRFGKKTLRLAALLLVIALLSGCGTGAAQAGQDQKTASPEPTATAKPLSEEETAKEQQEQQAREERLAVQKDGFVWDHGYLYTVDRDGNLICDTYVGVLYFDEDGRYTSGSKELDRLVAGVIRKNTDDSMSRMEKLRLMYNYTRDNIKYVGTANHENSFEPAHGKDGWMTECATFALENGTGNCYHFAATFAALARGLGYQAYAASGVIGSEEQPHGWVEIVDGSGKIWYCDPETEYSRVYWMKEEHDLFYKSKEDIGQTTGLGYLQMVDPFAAEKKEAQERAQSSVSGNKTDTKSTAAKPDSAGA